jgi:hypothetical protein
MVQSDDIVEPSMPLKVDLKIDRISKSRTPRIETAWSTHSFEERLLEQIFDRSLFRGVVPLPSVGGRQFFREETEVPVHVENVELSDHRIGILSITREIRPEAMTRKIMSVSNACLRR